LAKGVSIARNGFEGDDAPAGSYPLGQRKGDVTDIRADIIDSVASRDMFPNRFLQMRLVRSQKYPSFSAGEMQIR
jgi:hypothetical protein